MQFYWEVRRWADVTLMDENSSPKWRHDLTVSNWTFAVLSVYLHLFRLSFSDCQDFGLCNADSGVVELFAWILSSGNCNQMIFRVCFVWGGRTDELPSILIASGITGVGTRLWVVGCSRSWWRIWRRSRCSARAFATVGYSWYKVELWCVFGVASLCVVIYFHVSWKITDTRNIPLVFICCVDMPPKPIGLPMYRDDLQWFILCSSVLISIPFMHQLQIICQQMLRLGGGQQIEPVWELANRLSTLLATGKW